MANASHSKIMSKFKKRTKGGWKKSRKREAAAKGQQLPGGIVNGLAKLTKWELKEDKKGNPQFNFTGIVIEPEEYEGQRATVIHRIAATQSKTVEEKIDGLSSDLQLLGADVEDVDEDDIPALCEQLVGDEPVFKFNTWMPDGGDRAFVFIQGLADDVPFDTDDDDTDDDDDDDDDVEDTADDGDDDDGDDEDTVEADDDDDDADDDDADDDPDDDWEPGKGEVYMYRTNSRAKLQECEVTTVNKGKRTVGLKRLSDDKKFPNVSWEKLESEDDE